MMGEPDAFVGATVTVHVGRVEQCISGEEDVGHHTDAHHTHSQSTVNAQHALGDAQRAVLMVDARDLKRRRLDAGPVSLTSPPSPSSCTESCDEVGARHNGMHLQLSTLIARWALKNEDTVQYACFEIRAGFEVASRSQNVTLFAAFLVLIVQTHTYTHTKKTGSLPVCFSLSITLTILHAALTCTYTHSQLVLCELNSLDRSIVHSLTRPLTDPQASQTTSSLWWAVILMGGRQASCLFLMSQSATIQTRWWTTM